MNIPIKKRCNFFTYSSDVHIYMFMYDVHTHKHPQTPTQQR